MNYVISIIPNARPFLKTMKERSLNVDTEAINDKSSLTWLGYFNTGILPPDGIS